MNGEMSSTNATRMMGKATSPSPKATEGLLFIRLYCRRQRVNDEVPAHSHFYLLFGNRIRPKCAAQSWWQALKQVKPVAPMGCKLVGTVRGTKLWAGDCAAASELRGTTPAVEP